VIMDRCPVLRLCLRLLLSYQASGPTLFGGLLHAFEQAHWLGGLGQIGV